MSTTDWVRVLRAIIRVTRGVVDDMMATEITGSDSPESSSPNPQILQKQRYAALLLRKLCVASSF